MKAACFFCAASFALAVGAMADDIKTLDGKEYKGVTVSRTEPDGIVVVTDSGIEKIPFSNLPRDVQKKYGYDPAKAALYQKAVYDAYVAKQKQENPPTFQVVDAKQLIAMYDANELSADQNFKGWTGGCRGTITDIGRGIIGDIYIVLI